MCEQPGQEEKAFSDGSESAYAIVQRVLRKAMTTREPQLAPEERVRQIQAIQNDLKKGLDYLTALYSDTQGVPKEYTDYQARLLKEILQSILDARQTN